MKKIEQIDDDGIDRTGRTAIDRCMLENADTVHFKNHQTQLQEGKLTQKMKIII